ncbi:MAG: hypothetical protein ABWZ02_09665 [Nakamurella sp.]
MAPVVDFRYPGDDPAALAVVADQMDIAGTRIERLLTAVSLSRAALKGAWNMQASDLADADIGVLVDGLPIVRSALDSARTAITTQQTTLTRIRGEIDELKVRYRQQAAAIESATSDLAQLSTRTDPMAVVLGQGVAAAQNAAIGAQADIEAQYQQLLHDAETATQSCEDALTTSWNPNHRPSSGYLQNGPTLLDQAGISVGSLNMLRIDAEVAEAAGLSAALAGMQDMDPADPAVQQRIVRLAEIWNQESANGVFATKFYQTLGADDTVDMMARVAVLIQPNDGDGTGRVDPAMLQNLQHNMAGGLSLATAGLDYAADGSLQDTVPGGLDAGWVDALTAKGRSTMFVPVDGRPYQVRGYVPLLATLASGTGYSAGFLRTLGNDMKAVENQFAAESGTEFGDGVWTADGHSYTDSSSRPPVRWNWSTSGTGFPLGQDPLTSWTTAMRNSPVAAAAVFASDARAANPADTLLNHLLNGRSWAIPDSTDGQSGDGSYLHPRSEMPSTSKGLIAFGDSLAVIIGQGSTADSQQTLEGVVSLLGSNDTNRLIDSGSFETTDWVRPELRPGLSNILLNNAPTVHEHIAQSVNALKYEWITAEAAKDKSADDEGLTFADRMATAESNYMAEKRAVGDHQLVDTDGQARIAASLTHGYSSANIAEQLRADAEHNQLIDSLGLGSHFVASGLGQVPMVGSPLQSVADEVIDRLDRSLREDNELAARNNAAEEFSSNHDAWAAIVKNAVYADALNAGWVPSDQSVQLTDPEGHPYAWTDLTDEDKKKLTNAWDESLPSARPEDEASRAADVFTLQSDNLAILLRELQGDHK